MQPDPQQLAALGSSRFGECLLEVALPAAGWGLAVAFSPCGDCLAASSQGSQVTLVALDWRDAAGLQPDAAVAVGTPGSSCRVQHLQLPGLPLKCLAFLSNDLLVGGGFDFQPIVCRRGRDASWHVACTLQGGLPPVCCCSAAALR